MKKKIAIGCFVTLLIIGITTLFILFSKETPKDEMVLSNDVTDISEVFTDSDIPVIEETTPPPSIQIVMVGDMLMHERVMESGKKEDNSYNFDHLFTNVKNTIEEADLALVNQETILGGTDLGLSGYPAFNSPFELGTSLVNAGFDVILHATNHTLDKGKTGVLNCMDFWDTNYPNISYLGINKTEEDQNNNIFIYEQEGIKIAILNYTYGTNGINPPQDMPYIVNYLEEEKVITDLQYAEENADFTIVCPHWGTEYVLTATNTQKNWSKIFMDNGADLVIGTHPHVIEPIEMLTDENGNQMLVYYSIGNFVNGTSGTGVGTTNRMVGGIADITISLNENDEAYIKDYGVIPIVCHIDEKTDYTVYYLSDYTEDLAKENHILSQDSSFSLKACEELVNEVWGLE